MKKILIISLFVISEISIKAQNQKVSAKRITFPDRFCLYDAPLKPSFASGLPQKYQLNVYDRWGEVVFSSNDPNAGWDGKIKGNNATLGEIYVYSIIYRYPSDRKDQELLGNTTIVECE